MPEMSASDTETAISAAQDALPSFRALTARQRSRMLHKWFDLMLENSEDLAKLITWENGKPLNDARGEINYAASFFEWFAEEAPRTYGDTVPATVPGNRIFTLKEPVGVCGLITPWNFPAAMVCLIFLTEPALSPVHDARLTRNRTDHAQDRPCARRWLHCCG